MNEFKPEDDLRPDSSDYRPTRSRRSSNGPQLTVSRQNVMIGIGILVLLLIIIAIGSALKARTQHEAAQKNPNVAAKDINISNPSSLVNAGNADLSSGMIHYSHDVQATNEVSNIQPQNIRVPPIASTPTEAAPQPVNSQTHRIELPGNISEALSAQQQGINNNADTESSTLPTASATVVAFDGAKQPAIHDTADRAGHKPFHDVTKSPSIVPKNTVTTASVGTKSGSANIDGSLKNAPARHFTLQLSSASRSDTLHAYAKQQKLSNYQVYETKRDGKNWYVLVSGDYPTSGEAKSAIASLPADVQKNKPWVKPVYQVQQDLKK